MVRHGTKYRWDRDCRHRRVSYENLISKYRTDRGSLEEYRTRIFIHHVESPYELEVSCLVRSRHPFEFVGSRQPLSVPQVPKKKCSNVERAQKYCTALYGAPKYICELGSLET